MIRKSRTYVHRNLNKKQKQKRSNLPKNKQKRGKLLFVFPPRKWEEANQLLVCTIYLFIFVRIVGNTLPTYMCGILYCSCTSTL